MVSSLDSRVRLTTIPFDKKLMVSISIWSSMHPTFLWSLLALLLNWSVNSKERVARGSTDVELFTFPTKFGRNFKGVVP